MVLSWVNKERGSGRFVGDTPTFSYCFRSGCSFSQKLQTTNHVIDKLAKWDFNKLAFFLGDSLLPKF